MKGREIPQGVIIGAVALVVIVIAVIAYTMFGRGPEQVDPASIPAERLLDPDRPRVGQSPAATPGGL